MINIKYRWHSLKTKTDLFGQKFEALFELYMPEKYVDGNFFNSKEDAIKWMEQRIKEDELFADCDTLILTEMYFT